MTPAVEGLDDSAIDALGDRLRAHAQGLRTLLGALVRVGQRLDDALGVAVRGATELPPAARRQPPALITRTYAVTALASRREAIDLERRAT